MLNMRWFQCSLLEISCLQAVSLTHTHTYTHTHTHTQTQTYAHMTASIPFAFGKESKLVHLVSKLAPLYFCAQEKMHPPPTSCPSLTMPLMEAMTNGYLLKLALRILCTKKIVPKSPVKSSFWMLGDNSWNITEETFSFNAFQKMVGFQVHLKFVQSLGRSATWNTFLEEGGGGGGGMNRRIKIHASEELEVNKFMKIRWKGVTSKVCKPKTAVWTKIVDFTSNQGRSNRFDMKRRIGECGYVSSNICYC